MLDMGRIVRSIIIGLVLGIVLLGLLPFLLVDMASDLSGIRELDSSPLLASVSRFIRWGK